MSSFDRSEIFIYSPRLSVFLQLPDSTSGDGGKKGKIRVWFEAAQEIAGLCPKRAGCSCCVPGTGLCRFLPLGPCLCCFSEPKLQRKAAWKKFLCGCCFVGERIREKCFVFLLSGGKSQHAAFAGVMGATCMSLLLKDKRCTVGGCTARERRSIPCTTCKQNLL